MVVGRLRAEEDGRAFVVVPPACHSASCALFSFSGGWCLLLVSDCGRSYGAVVEERLPVVELLAVDERHEVLTLDHLWADGQQ